jgi:hypothetical protein
VLVDQLWRFLDLATGRSDARRVPDGKVLIARDRAFRQNLHLATVERVEAKRLLDRPFGTRQSFIPFRHLSSSRDLPAVGAPATGAPLRNIDPMRRCADQDQRR